MSVSPDVEWINLSMFSASSKGICRVEAYRLIGQQFSELWLCAHEENYFQIWIRTTICYACMYVMKYVVWARYRILNFVPIWSRSPFSLKIIPLALILDVENTGIFNWQIIGITNQPPHEAKIENFINQ